MQMPRSSSNRKSAAVSPVASRSSSRIGRATATTSSPLSQTWDSFITPCASLKRWGSPSHHGGERLLGHAAGLQEAREVGALAQLRDAQLNRAGAGLPDPVTVAVALGQTLGILLAIGYPGLAFDFQLHQPLRGKSDHLAQQIGVRGLLYRKRVGAPT